MDINYIKFEEFLTYPECVDVYKSSVINNTKFFAGWQTGGRIDFIDDDNIIFSTGDFGDWSLPQNEESFFGKIIKFNVSSKKISFISKGHRNPQGLYWDELKNLILSTEHGPMGGDEINKIKITEKKIINYGWPMASYGEHYRNTPLNYYIHKTAPLKKSHKDYGFEEPVKVYKIGIGISQIIKNNISNIKNDYLITSLQDKSLHNIIFDENLENILFEDKIVLNERVRDIIFDKYTKRYYLSLENTPAIGVLEKY
jgi:glucose/arabinose dehydrogenase